MSEEKEWVADEASRARARAELTAIDMSHEGKPKCIVCGQRCNRLDKYGACSKISDAHKAHRGEMKAQVRS